MNPNCFFPRRAICAFLLGSLFAALSFVSADDTEPSRRHVWTNVGLGGGGGMFAPAVSPHDPKLMFVNCDMGGFYRTADGGRSWRMVSFREIQSNTRCHPVFHPVDPNVVFASAGGERFGVRVTRDGGLTWAPFAQDAPWKVLRVTALGIDREDGSTMLVSTEGGVSASRNGGRTWTAVKEVAGRTLGFHIVGNAGGGALIAATTDGVYRSDDDGRTWLPASRGLPWRDIRSFCGGTDASTGKTVLFVTIVSEEVEGRFAGGIFRSVDVGESWQSAVGDGLNTRLGKVDEWGSGEIAQYRNLAMPAGRTDVVYCSALGTGYYPPHHNTVYVSRDSGKTWKYCFNGDPRFKEQNIELGWYTRDVMWDQSDWDLAVCDSDPDIAVHTGGKLYVTENGGKSWRQGYSKRAPGQGEPGKGRRWHSIGLEVTTTWDYVIDPTTPERHYICYTDIGFARSIDRGKTWIHSTNGSPWHNTCYQIACDPERPGVIYGAWSNVHDIPHSTYTQPERRVGPGGVGISTDYGATWRSSSKGLPSAPVTSIALDPTSPPDARVLYVTSIGHGVYKSTDSGRTWVRKSRGLGVHGNMQTYLVKRHPSGALYSSITCARKGQEFPTADTGLYVSTDGAENWTKISKSIDLGWPTGFAVHPTDRRIAYMCASNWGPCRTGGLYRTTDGGKNWKRIFSNESPAYEGYGVESYFVRFRPDDPETLYYSTGTQGLLLSRDGGVTWKPFTELPFASIHRVTFDPATEGLIYVTTFGSGAWHGPAVPEAEVEWSQAPGR